MEQKNNLRPLWDAILQIYSAIDGVCRRHGLRWYLSDGSCLGAVRHHGFIPWDDDFDIVMPWEDYDLFWKYAREELPAYWKDVGWWNCPDNGLLFGKIQECRKEVVDRVMEQSGLKLPSGIFVDIFPLSCLPRTWYGKLAWKMEGLLLELRAKYVLEKGARITFKRKVAALLGFFLKPIYPSLKDLQSCMAIHEKRARRVPMDRGSVCGWYAPPAYTVISPFPVVYLKGSVMVPFENMNVPIVKEYDKYLRCVFGDYMELPPVEKRKYTHEDGGVASWRLGPPAK